MPSTGVVFVLYEPDQSALAHLATVGQGCPRIVVVDNSVAPDPQLHERLSADGMQVIDNRNRGGLAGAYNRGLRALIDAGTDLCFLLDQDSEIAPTLFATIGESADALGRDDFLIGPRIFEIAMATWLPTWADDAGVADGARVRQVDQLISSGSAVSATAFEKLGPFREDFFIEWLDVEYCLRAARAGIPRFVDTAAVLRQRQGAITRHGNFFTTNHPPARRYYHVRNGIWTVRRHYAKKAVLAGAIRLVLREIWVATRFERHKVLKVLAVLAGASDGARGRLGAFEQRRPRLHRLATDAARSARSVGAAGGQPGAGER